jgi:thiol-disulfide isomerase/thioredoxin
MEYLIFIIIALIIFGIWYFKEKSSFDTSETKVLIFHSPGCGHCTNAMPEFKKAMESCNKIELIDGSENRELVNKYKIQGFPTIIKSDNTPYNGARKAEDILEFAKK